MPKVCFVALNAYKLFDPQSSAKMGGSELQMHAIAEGLSRKDDFDISFIVGDFHQNALQRFGNISVYASFALQKTLTVFIMAPFVMFALLWRIRPDVIISSPAGPEMAFLGIYARIMGATYIYRVASDIDVSGEKQKQLGLIAGSLYRLGIACSHLLVAQHVGQQEMLERAYQKPSIVIPNIGITGVKKSSLTKKDRIIWIGSSRPVKRLDVLFDIARRMPEYSFAVVLSHSGEERIFRDAQLQADALQNVEFLGELSSQEVEKELVASSILLGTSDYEGFPNTYLQAFFSHVPVVSLRVDPDKIFANSRFGICTNGDIDATQKTLRKLMKDQVMRADFAHRAYQYAQGKHGSSTVLQKWIFAIRTKHYSQLETGA